MTIDEIKQQLTIAEVLSHYGLRPNRTGMLKCPLHDDRKASMKVYFDTNTVYCFAGGCITKDKSLDVIDLIMFLEKCTKHEAILKAKSMINPVVQNGKMNFTNYQASIKRSKNAQNYCESRCLDWKSGEIGFKSVKTSEKWGRNCIIFPLKNAVNEVVSLYGRSINGGGHYYQSGRSGLYPGYPKSSTKTLVLCESIIDAASLKSINLPFENYELLSLYGTNGLNEEHRLAILQCTDLEEIIFAFDEDEAGRKAVVIHYQKLEKELPNIKFSTLELPEGEDVNSLIVNHENGAGLFELLFSHRQQLRDIKGVKQPALIDFDTSNPERIRYKDRELELIIWGQLYRKNLHQLKVSLQLKKGKEDFREEVNLYSHQKVNSFVKSACEELEIAESVLKGVLKRLTKQLEQYRLALQKKSEEGLQAKKVELSAAQAREGMAILTDKNCVKTIENTLKKVGLIGEQNNGLLLFFIFLTRYFEVPLHALVHGSSGSGKTNLLKTVLKLVPEESVYITTSLSENVLFYPPYAEFWSYKVLLLEDMDGSQKALLAIREFMSNQSITKYITEHDPRTGQFRQKKLEAKGPTCFAGATTKSYIYEDNANRSFLIYVDESNQHKEAVLAFQNEQAASLQKQSLQVALEQLHHAQRLLKPIAVINPYQPELIIPEVVFKRLRSNMQYITLIKAIAFFHQYQRPQKTAADGTKYIEATFDDIALANRLCRQSLIRKGDELKEDIRSFFETIKALQKQHQRGDNFLLPDIRKELRMHPQKLKRKIGKLKQFGLIRRIGGTQYSSGYEYQIREWEDYNILQVAINEMDANLLRLRKKYNK